jgi:hypothetical protein
MLHDHLHGKIPVQHFLVAVVLESNGDMVAMVTLHARYADIV